MIEKIVRDYLQNKLGMPVCMEKQKNTREYVLVEKTGSGRNNFINSATFALQSYSTSMEKAALLNERVKRAMDEMIIENTVYSSKLNTDYPFTDVETKEYRYQAIYDITY